MGITKKFNNWISSIQNVNGITHKKAQQFVLVDDNKIVDMITLCSDNMKTLNLLIQAKQHCTIDRIEKIKDDYIYKIHCKDKNGNLKLFSFERLYK